MPFVYVYILQSQLAPTRFYTGLTSNLSQRLHKHNEGGVPHTADYRPWAIKTAVAFSDPLQARKFEHYLKTASGRTFARKRL